MKTLIFAISLLGLYSCSSTSEKVISRMDYTQRPAWASQSRAVSIKDGKLLLLGFQELDADAKLSAAFRLSDSQTRGELSKMIQTQFSSILQNLEEGVADEASMTRYYASEVSKTVVRDLRIVQRYWEKVQTFDQDGDRALRLRVYSLAEIPEAKFKKLMRETLVKDKIDPTVKQQVLGHFENEIKAFENHN